MLPVWAAVPSYALGQGEGTRCERPVMTYADIYPCASFMNQDTGNGETPVDAHSALRKTEVLRQKIRHMPFSPDRFAVCRPFPPQDSSRNILQVTSGLQGRQAMDIIAAGKETDMTDSRGSLHNPAGGTVAASDFNIHFVASRHRMNGRSRFDSRLISRLLRCPERPEDRLRLGGSDNELSLSG